MSEYKTPKGKTITLYNEGMMVKAQFKEGGQLPKCLAGAWTDKTKAEQCIIKYLSDKNPNKNVTEGSTEE